MYLFGLEEGNQGRCSSSLPPSPSRLRARVGPLELANALAACVLSARLTSKHRQWAVQQLVKALAAAGRETPNRPQTYSDLAGDLRKCPLKRLEGHYNKVSFLVLLFYKWHIFMVNFFSSLRRNIVEICFVSCYLCRFAAVSGTVSRVCLQRALKTRWCNCGESAKMLWSYRPPSPALLGYSCIFSYCFTLVSVLCLLLNNLIYL